MANFFDQFDETQGVDTSLPSGLGYTLDNMPPEAQMELSVPEGDFVLMPPKPPVGGNIFGQFDAPETVATSQQSGDYNANKTQSALLGLTQGATFGFADEVAAAGAALGALATGGDPKEAYKNAWLEQQDAIKAAKEQEGGAFLGGEIGGGLTTGIAGGAKLAGTKLLQGANTVRGSAGVGALSGGAYAAGTSTGDLGKRFEAIPQGAGLGAVGGAVGGVVANQLGRAGRSLTERARGLFAGKQAPVAPQPIQEVALSGKALSEVPELGALQGQQVAMPKGARTGDVNLMRIEENARQGLLGQDAQRTMQSIDAMTEADVLDRVQALTGRTTAESGDILSGGLGKVQDVFKKRKELQNKLMTARNDAIAKTDIYKSYVKDTLQSPLKALKDTPDFQVALAKESNKPLLDEFKAFNRIAKKKGDVNFAFLQSWRSGLNDLRKGGDQKATLAGQMANVYDEWLDNITIDAIKAGDEDVANKIINANKEYSKYKSLYGTNKRTGQNSAIEKVLTQEELTPEQAVNTVFGKSVTGNQATAQNLERILKGIENPELKEQVASEFRGGLIKRAYENATKTGQLKLGSLKNELIKIRRSEPYKMNLSNPEADSVMDGLISDLGKVVDAQSRRDVYAPSAPAVMRGIEGLLDKAGYLPMVGGTARGFASMTGELGKKAATRGDVRKLEKALEETFKTIQPSTTRVYGAITGGQQAGESR